MRARVQYNTVLLLFGDGYATKGTVLSIDLDLEREHSHERERVRLEEYRHKPAGNRNRHRCGVENDVADGDVDERVEGECVGVRIVIEGSAVNNRGIDNEICRVFAIDSDNETVEFDRDFFRDEFGEVLVFERDTRERTRSIRRLIGVDFEVVVNHIIDAYHKKNSHSFCVFVP